MIKNKVKLTICSNELTIVSDDEPSYIHTIGEEVKERISSLSTDTLDRTDMMAVLLAALQFCDEAHKSEKEAENLKLIISKIEEENRLQKKELDEAINENKQLSEAVADLRIQLHDAINRVKLLEHQRQQSLFDINKEQSENGTESVNEEVFEENPMQITFDTLEIDVKPVEDTSISAEKSENEPHPKALKQERKRRQKRSK